MKPLKHSILAEQKWLRLVAAEGSINGQTKQWIYCSRREDFKQAPTRPDAVVIVAFDHTEATSRVLLLSEYRMPINQEIIAFPAGLMEPGESIEDCARRELREETGYAITRVLETSAPLLFPSAGLTDESFAYIFVEATRVGSPAPEASEQIEVLHPNLDELKHLMESGTGFCGRTWPLCREYLRAGEWPASAVASTPMKCEAMPDQTKNSSR